MKTKGRPSEFSDAELELAKLAAPNVRSKRQLQTVAYRQRVIGALIDDDCFAWLIDRESADRGEGKWKPTILAELGRLGDPATIQDVALQICDWKPSDKEAIGAIRRFRGLRQSPGTVSGLTDAIVKAVGAYNDSHPRLTLQQMREALRSVLEIISEIENR